MELQQQTEEEQQTVFSATQSAPETIPQPLHVPEGEEALVEPQGVTELLATTQLQHKQRGILAFFFLLLIVQVAFVSVFPRSPIALLSYIATVSLMAFISVMFAIRYRNVTKALAQVDDVRMVGPLIDRLHSGRRGRWTRRLVRQALIRLLPRLQASDAPLLTSAQKGQLTRHLARLALFQRDKEFQIIILRAFEQVGDAQSIPVVESIAHRQPKWAAQEKVQAAAVECLPFLLQRAEDDRSRQTLLRASSDTKANGGELLRPAEEATECNPLELLRADVSHHESR